MLGKLLRYEFKSIGRLFLPLYGLSILLAIANRFTSYNPKWEYELPEFILMFAFMAILMGLALITRDGVEMELKAQGWTPQSEQA